MKITIKDDGNGFDVLKYSRRGALVYAKHALDEMELFKVLAELLDVTFVERYGPPVPDLVAKDE